MATCQGKPAVDRDRWGGFERIKTGEAVGNYCGYLAFPVGPSPPPSLEVLGWRSHFPMCCPAKNTMKSVPDNKSRKAWKDFEFSVLGNFFMNKDIFFYRFKWFEIKTRKVFLCMYFKLSRDYGLRYHRLSSFRFRETFQTFSYRVFEEPNNGRA